jgi:hypothetical protein
MWSRKITVDADGALIGVTGLGGLVNGMVCEAEMIPNLRVGWNEFGGPGEILQGLVVIALFEVFLSQ